MSYAVGPSGDIIQYATSLPDDYTDIQDPPTTLLKPTWDGSAWVESATAQEITDAIEAHRKSLMDQVDEYAAERFFRALATDALTERAVIYKSLEHLLKAMEANEIVNDRDAPPVPRRPKKHKGGSTKTFPLCEAEAAERGITREQLADAIIPLADQQDGLFATLARYRPVYRDQIENYVATGVYADDIAALDAIYAAYVAAVDAVLGV